MFEVALGLIQVIGFLASTYFIVFWLPASWRARQKRLLNVSTLAYVDFVGFPIMAFVVYALTMYNLFQYGILPSGSPTQAVQRFVLWLMVTSIVVIRAIHWTKEWVKAPKQAPSLKE